MPGKTTSLRKNSIIFKSCQEERYMKNRKSSKLLALGLVFRRPVIKANDWIIEKLESTKLI